MSKSRMPLILGLGAAGGIGYYLYNSGGNAQAAEKKFESDVHKASASIKSHLPTGKDIKGAGAEAGAKFDKAIAEGEKQLNQARSSAESYVKGAQAEALKAVDKFDQKVEEGSAKAKSSITSWFSSGNK
ncbi:hypothetical protein VHEMI07374 [[Torrubiella] hemipterigena]|uniref:Calcofluor white hypersensitive protein n=1 Tax=[Torrubiella] hemipterigena TaxID=1531966 RepID=A0A0A1TLM5_9HYPO|nr:hypothetical protein VHEMI07374 [[Torrubiella] hemipterigena]